jgi:PPIC-type PPIASE domain
LAAPAADGLTESAVLKYRQGRQFIMFSRVFREPLVHFLALALAIFAAYHLLTPSRGEGRADQIVVTVPKIQQLGAIFAKTWQRPPTPQELKGLIDDNVKEEIYVREALALGLDKDDTVIRRRLRQKMEFLNDADADALTPSEADLQANLQAHADKFELDPALSIQQVFLNPDRRQGTIAQDAEAILNRLRADPSLDPGAMGDVSLLPGETPMTDKATIGNTFGPEFVDAVGKAETGQWIGPIASSFGLHVVRVTQSRAGRLPALDEVRDAVAREWSVEKRKQLEDARLNGLLKHYQVTIETAPVAGAGS